MSAWKAVTCRKWCHSGYRGMDRCNACGCTGSQLLHLPSNDLYPNTEDGWNQLVFEHPENKEEQTSSPAVEDRP